MTIQSENRKSGPFQGDGRVSRFPFDFKVFDESDLRVVVHTGDVERSLLHGSDYEVSLQADQEMAPGGEVLLKTPLSDGAHLVIVSAIPPLQLAKFTNQGGFYPVVLNDALDRLTILCQQLSEKSDRAIRYGVTSGNLSSELPPPKAGFGIGWSEDGRSLVNTDYHIKAAASAQAAQESYAAAQNAALSAAASADEAKKAVPVIYGNASTAAAGIVRLSSATDSTDETQAATPKAVKAAYDRAVAAEGKGIPLGAVLAFPKSVHNPAGYLKADGSTFDQATYPDLYAALGNSNKLPDLRRHNIGMLAYFPTDTAPEGWLPCDGRTVSQAEYPELYAYLGSRYGAPGQLPDAQDRYIRNAGAGLTVGQKQKGSLGITDGHPSFSVSSLSYNGTNALSADEVAEMMGGDPLVPNYADYAFPDNTRPDNPGIVASWTSGTGEPVSSDGRVYSRTSGEVVLYGIRPKTIVFKLFIKAKDGAAEAAYWIRAYGAVSNTGSLDASALAAAVHNAGSQAQQAHSRIGSVEQDLGGRIDGIVQQIQALQTAAQTDETGYLKVGSIIIQWGRSSVRSGHRIHFPIAFPSACHNVQITADNHYDPVAPFNRDAAGFSLYTRGNGNIYWLAVGH